VVAAAAEINLGLVQVGVATVEAARVTVQIVSTSTIILAMQQPQCFALTVLLVAVGQVLLRCM